MRSRNLIVIFSLFVAALLLAAFVYPTGWNKLASFIHLPEISQRPFSLGLDLSGGTLLVYDADLKNIDPKDYSSAMGGLRDVLEQRVNYMGVREPRIEINKSGDQWRLIVELAGIKDVREAIKMIGETPYLEFKEIRTEEESNNILQLQEEEIKKDEPDEAILSLDPYFKATNLTGKYLERAMVDFDPNTSIPVVDLQFNAEGTKIFASLTKTNVGKPLAIYLDGQPISIPEVREEIPSGKAQISGKFTLPEAKKLSERLNQGALPVPIKLVSQQSVGAILGQESIKHITQAAWWGFLAVIIFMIVFYRLPGFLAALSLIIYVIISLSIFKAVPVTLTLAGITGFILSVGTAVDANILIFEYSKEEIHKGKSMRLAMEDGFQRSWPAIRDSNIATIISAVILYYFSSSMIRGFALTLAIGVGVSLITALYITRLFLMTLATDRTPTKLFCSTKKD